MIPLRTRPPRGRAGFTLVEMLVALTVFGVITTAALGMLRSQVRAFATATERMHVLQNLRYAANLLEKDLRTVGSGVPATQPFLAFAGADAIAFNADYVSNVENDPFAVYSDTTAPDAETSVLPASRAITIPGTSTTYPDTTYYDGGAESPAETILFSFEPDTSTARPDDFVLNRRVNDATPEIVARDLLRTDDAPFFEHLRLHAPPDTTPSLQTVPQASLPLHHVAPIHLSGPDTGSVAVIDSVRAVRIEFTATNTTRGRASSRPWPTPGSPRRGRASTATPTSIPTAASPCSRTPSPSTTRTAIPSPASTGTRMSARRARRPDSTASSAASSSSPRTRAARG